MVFVFKTSQSFDDYFDRAIFEGGKKLQHSGEHSYFLCVNLSFTDYYKDMFGCKVVILAICIQICSSSSPNLYRTLRKNGFHR
jgi:hypothetical protein